METENTETRRLTADEIAATVRHHDIRALGRARIGLAFHQKRRKDHDTQAAEALAEIQRLRRKLGV